MTTSGTMGTAGAPSGAEELQKVFKTLADPTRVRILRLLEQEELPIDEVSAAVGYLDISFFRRLFKRLTGLTPGQYRRMFQPFRLAHA